MTSRWRTPPVRSPAIDLPRASAASSTVLPTSIGTSLTWAMRQISRDSAALHLSTIFDIDYADGAARADTAIYVFNEDRENWFSSARDSNIADDQPPDKLDMSDLARVRSARATPSSAPRN